MPLAGKAKTKLVDGVRVNTRDNSVASPSTYGQGKNAKIKGLTVGDVYSPERQYEDVSAAANLEKLKKKNAWEHSYARKEGKTYTPTVLTDENIRTGAIPQIKNEAQQLLGQPQGTAQNPGDTPQDGQQNTEEPANEYDQLYQGLMGTSPAADPFYDTELKLLENMQKTSDARTQASLDALTSTYNARRAEQRAAVGAEKGAAQTLLMSGGGYRSGSGSRVISGIERAGIREIASLDAQEQSLKADALAAQTESDYKILGEKLGLLKEKRAEKQKAIADILDQQAKEKQETQKGINDVLKDAAKNGAPKDIQDAILGANSVGDAIANAGSWLATGSGTIGEYLFYKREAEASGQTPMSFNAYADMDANRKRSIVNVNSGGLTTQENSSFLRITDKFQADPIINAAVKGDQIKAMADAVIADPNSATNQLASLYMFVKNLDPDSAVREGELSLANATQSYQQQFSNTLARLSTGRVVSPEAAKALAEATKRLVGTWEDTAKKKTQFYQSQAQNSSKNVGDAFSRYVSDSKALPSTSEMIAEDENAANVKLQSVYGDYKEQVDALIRQNPSISTPEILEVLGIQ